MPNHAEADISLEFLDSRHCNFMAMQKMPNKEQKRKSRMRRWNRRWSLTSCPSAKSDLSKQLIKSEGNFEEKKKHMRNISNMKLSPTPFSFIQFMYNWLLDLADRSESFLSFFRSCALDQLMTTALHQQSCFEFFAPVGLLLLQWDKYPRLSFNGNNTRTRKKW